MSEPQVSTVLLVDDTVEIRYLLRILLANVRLCRVVAEAKDGQEAIELAERLQPDVIILDVEMPVLTGLEALPRIKEVSPASKVIVYSSHPEMNGEAMKLGAFRYLEKGKDPHDVVEAVRDAVLAR